MRYALVYGSEYRFRMQDISIFVTSIIFLKVFIYLCRKNQQTQSGTQLMYVVFSSLHTLPISWFLDPLITKFMAMIFGILESLGALYLVMEKLLAM